MPLLPGSGLAARAAPALPALRQARSQRDQRVAVRMRSSGQEQQPASSGGGGEVEAPGTPTGGASSPQPQQPAADATSTAGPSSEVTAAAAGAPAAAAAAGAAAGAAAAPAPPPTPQQAAAPRRRAGSGTIKAAGAKAEQLLQHLQERPLPQLSPALSAFLACGVVLTGLVYVWARGSSVRRNNPYTFTMHFSIANKVYPGTPLRMKGVQVGRVTEVAVEPTRVAVAAEVFDARNVVPLGSRFDINQLGLVPEAFIDITTPDACSVAGAAGPHTAACHKQGRIVCQNSAVDGSQGSSMDFMMKVYLKHLKGSDRERPQLVEGERYRPGPQPAAAAGSGGSQQQQQQDG